MKTKIAAAVLAAVLLLHVGGEYTRAKATGAVVAVATIGVLAWQLLGVMTGAYDDTANAIGELLESGVDAFTNPDSTFQSEYVSKWIDGWNILYNKLTEWTEDYSITFTDEGKVRMKYSQYLELCGLIGDAYATTDVQLVTDIPYLLFKADRDVQYKINDSIMVCSIDDLADGMSYSTVFYTDDKIYFCSNTLSIKLRPWLDSNPNAYTNTFFEKWNLVNSSYDTGSTLLNGLYSNVPYTDFFNQFDFSFGGGTSQSSVTFSPNRNTSYSTYTLPSSWYCYDGSRLTASSPDLSNTSMAILCCKGRYVDFIKSIISYSSSSTPVELDDLSDPLASVLTKTTDPTLEIDTDPAIVSPDEAINVSDIPGEGDVTLSQLKEKTKTDIDIPSLIADKFPFCIPFDFIRILSVLCADPVAPVFRIPISTDLENIVPFEGNQTIGEYPEDFEPLFEIDEEIVIDLSCIPLVQPVCYTVFILGFVILLIYITPKMINH